jgi:hypothetical protein
MLHIAKPDAGRSSRFPYLGLTTYTRFDLAIFRVRNTFGLSGRIILPSREDSGFVARLTETPEDEPEA